MLEPAIVTNQSATSRHLMKGDGMHMASHAINKRENLLLARREEGRSMVVWWWLGRRNLETCLFQGLDLLFQLVLVVWVPIQQCHDADSKIVSRIHGVNGVLPKF